MCSKAVFGGLAALFGIRAPKAPSPPPAPPAPTEDTAGVQAAAEAERKRQRLAAGRDSTILAGGMLDQPNPATPKALLGA